ncbi:paramyosin isoform X2 [Ixodes scapularis]|uniref:paramyosin isoform X2 n=1 Tax=Ixodes scapularis TaxID=6945 RepID=UPI0011619D37|nr:paramyosin isoform X2 [Ixodes scapularis]
MAPRNWKRPLTLIYNDNYKYGNSLYSGAIDDIEKRYQASMSRTAFRSDRGDLGLTTFSSSQIGSAPEPSSSRPTTNASEPEPTLLSPSFSAPSRSPARSVLDIDTDLRKARSSGDFGRLRSSYRPTSWSDDEDLGLLDDPGYSRRRRRRRQDRNDYLLTSPSAAGGDFYLEKCRELKGELEALHGRVMDAESRARNEAGNLRSKVQAEIAELSLQLEDTTLQNNELQKAVKRQAKQLLAYCDEMQRHMQGAVDDLSMANKRCLDLQNEVESLRSNLESGVRHI